MNISEKNRIAHHEAAHAVASIGFGRGFTNVTILSDGEYKGCLRGTEGLRDRQKEIISQLAGYAADVKLSPETKASARQGAEGDFLEATFSMQCIDSSDIEFWIQEATKFVEANWKAISDLAENLLEHRSLSGQEAESIVQMSDSKQSGQ